MPGFLQYVLSGINQLATIYRISFELFNND
jgi:hypothetical protein